MKYLVRSCAFISLFVSSLAQAEIIDFEQYSPGNGQHTYASNERSFGPALTIEKSNPEAFIGYAISSKSALTDNPPDPNGYFLNGDDTVSANGTGANGSATWLTVYEYHFDGLNDAFSQISTVFQAAPNYQFKELRFNTLALNEYAVTSGLGNTFPFIPGDFFQVRFLSLDGGNSIVNQTSWFDIARWNVNGSLDIETSWRTVNLSSMNATRLAIQFADTFDGASPSYIALDNIELSAVPEPSAWLVLAGAGITVRAWRNRQKFQRSR